MDKTRLRWLSALLTGILFVASSAVAAAQPRGGTTPDCAKLRQAGQRCKDVVIDEGDRLTGELQRPGGDNLVVRTGTAWPTLIKPRTQLLDRIIASANDLP